jgi:hypothetical protein
MKFSLVAATAIVIMVELSHAAPNASRIMGGVEVWHEDYPYVSRLERVNCYVLGC